MYNIVRSGFSRLKKSGIYKICLAAVAAITLYSVIFGAKVIAEGRTGGSLDSLYFNMGPFLALVIPAFISLFVGTEFSDGAIRNKLITGCRRRDVYLGMLITVSSASLGFVAVWYLVGLIGIPLVGTWEIGFRMLLIFLIISILLALSTSAFFCMIAYIITQKAAGAVVAIVLGILLILGGSSLYNRLLEPEFERDAVIVNGEFVLGEPRPNSLYVPGKAREICKGVLNSLPTGQAILMANYNHNPEEGLADIGIMLISSPIEILIFAAAGTVLFCKKDIK